MTDGWPALSKGAEMLRRRSRQWRNFGVVTTASPWSLAHSILENAPERIVFIGSTDRGELDLAADQLEGVELVIGLGGGIAMDAAKYAAKKTRARLVQVPSTASTNACFTCACWVSEGGVRRAERGMPLPEEIVVDHQLVLAAPARLNRAGLAEILCSHTALFDWRLGHRAGKDVDWDDGLEELTRAELVRLEGTAPAVGTDRLDGFIALFDAGRRLAPWFISHPRARFNSGSEHLFAWALEERAGRRLVHGETVSLGILLMALLQNNAPDWAARIVLGANIGFEPAAIGVTWDEVADTITALPKFARSFPWHTVLDEPDWTKASRYDRSRRIEAMRTFVGALR